MSEDVKQTQESGLRGAFTEAAAEPALDLIQDFEQDYKNLNPNDPKALKKLADKAKALHIQNASLDDSSPALQGFIPRLNGIIERIIIREKKRKEESLHHLRLFTKKQAKERFEKRMKDFQDMLDLMWQRMQDILEDIDRRRGWVDGGESAILEGKTQRDDAGNYLDDRMQTLLVLYMERNGLTDAPKISDDQALAFVEEEMEYQREKIAELSEEYNQISSDYEKFMQVGEEYVEEYKLIMEQDMSDEQRTEKLENLFKKMGVDKIEMAMGLGVDDKRATKALKHARENLSAEEKLEVVATQSTDWGAGF